MNHKRYLIKNENSSNKIISAIVYTNDTVSR